MATTSQTSVDLINKYYVLVKQINKNNEVVIDLMSNQLINEISSNQMLSIVNNETKLWHKLVKKTLKVSLNEELKDETIGGQLLDALFNLVDKLPPNATSLETTFDLISGHSMFDNILIDENYANSELKKRLISVLCIIYEKDNKLCVRNEIIELILSAYNCSMTQSDQRLLRLLALFEKNGCHLYKYQPFMWGINAAIHYSIKKEKSTLLKEPKIEEIFSAVNQDNLRFTLNNFPIELTLNPIEIVEISSGQLVYDPRFLLPLFYQLLSSQSIVKCHKFVSYGALSYTIVCLSSSCDRMRSLAYCVLSRFYQHLESATFPRDRFLWIGLIDYIRSGITSDNLQLKSLVAVFIVRIIDILLHPNDKLYENVKRFIVNRPTLQLNVLPSFYDIINSSDIENRKRFERFIISWICDGLRTEDDIKLCLKRNVFSEMLELYESVLSDNENQVLILTLLERCCRQYLGAKVLCTENALFCWLKQTIVNIKNSSYASIHIQEFFKIVSTVWETISNRYLSANNENTKSEYLLYPSFCYEVIDILRVIINIDPENDIIDKYVEIYKFILSSFPNDCCLLSLLVFENVPQTTTNVAINKE